MAEGTQGLSDASYLDKIAALAFNSGSAIVAAKVNAEIQDKTADGVNGSQVSNPTQDNQGKDSGVTFGGLLTSGVNKTILYGSLALLAVAIVWKVVKK